MALPFLLKSASRGTERDVSEFGAEKGRNPGSRGGAVIDLIDRADLTVRLAPEFAQDVPARLRPAGVPRPA